MRELDTSDIASYITNNDIIEPVLIKQQGKPVSVILSCEHYISVRNNNRQVLRVDELSDEDINAIRTSAPPATHDQYNDELDET